MGEQLAGPARLFGKKTKTNEALESFLLSMRNNRHGRLQLQSQSAVSFPIVESPRVFARRARFSPSPPPAILTPRPSLFWTH